MDLPFTGAASINPATGRPWGDNSPDDVAATDLPLGTNPLASGVANAVGGLPFGAALASMAGKQGEPGGMLGTPLPPPATSAPAGGLIPELKQALAAVPPPSAVAPAPSGGGGGGGGPAMPPGGPAPAKPSKDEAAARLEQQRAEGMSLSAADQQKKVEVDRANAIAAQDQRQADETAKFQADAQARLKAAGDHLEAIKEQRSKMQVRDMFQGHQGAAIAAALFEGLGAFAAGITGGPNYAMKVIEDGMARYRQQQIDQLDLKDREATGAQEALHNAHLELSAAEAGMYKRLADQRAAVVSKFGGDAAAVEGDKLRAELLQRSADKGMQVAQGLQERGDKLMMQASTIALQRSEIAKNAAETGKLRAEATAGPKQNAKGIVDERKRAALAVGLEDQDRIARDLESKGVRLTEEDRQRIQDNRTYLEAAKRGDKNVMDALATTLLRKGGALPRNETDGLTVPKKRLAGALELMTQKAALLNAGSNTAEGIGLARDDVDLLKPGMGPEETSRRREYIRTDLIGVNKGLVPGGVAQARGGADVAAQSADPAKVQQVKAWLQSPEARAQPAKAAAYMSKLREMGAL